MKNKFIKVYFYLIHSNLLLVNGWCIPGGVILGGGGAIYVDVPGVGFGIKPMGFHCMAVMYLRISEINHHIWCHKKERGSIFETYW